MWNDNSSSSIGTTTNPFLIRFFDSSNVVRLRVRPTGNTSTLPLVIEKLSAAGVITQLGGNSISAFTGAIQKFDIHVNYGTSGSVDLYIDGTLVLSTGTVDTTTDGATSLSGFDLGFNVMGISGISGGTNWSELIVADTDTRSLNLITCQPNGAGTLSQWTGTAAGTTVNEVTLSDVDGIDTGVANNVSLFTQPGTIPANIDYGILAVVVSARAVTTTDGTKPQHMDLSIRQNGTVYNSSDKTITLAMAPYQNVWNTNPNTGVAWAITDFSTALTQIGVKAIA
jgi:hypothetical protein